MLTACCHTGNTLSKKRNRLASQALANILFVKMNDTTLAQYRRDRSAKRSLKEQRARTNAAQRKLFSELPELLPLNIIQQTVEDIMESSDEEPTSIHEGANADGYDGDTVCDTDEIDFNKPTASDASEDDYETCSEDDDDCE